MAPSKRYPFRKDSAHSDSVKMDQDGPYNDWFNDSGVRCAFLFFLFFSSPCTTKYTAPLTCIVQFETAHEQRSEVELQVEGTIPPYAAGTLYRTGMSIISLPTSTTPTLLGSKPTIIKNVADERFLLALKAPEVRAL